MKHNRALLVATLFTAGLLFVVGGFFGLPAITSTRVAAAQVEFQGGATQEMLDYALNFGRATDFAVFGGRRVVNRGESNFRGRVGSGGNVEGVAGMTEGESPESRGQAKQDLKDALRWIGQLPCADVDSPNLAGRTFTPGVYCLPSADLIGEMTIDARGNENARFVFRISGGLTTGEESSIRLIDGARASNVYIVADGPITIGDESSIRANVISKGTVTIGAGTDISGKSIGVEGEIDVESSSLGNGSGFIQICKELAPGETTIPANQLFTFRIVGVTQTYTIPAGSCTAPISVAAGEVTVSEDLRANTAVISIVTNPANRRVSVSLATRQVVVAVPEGDVTDETVITFTNQTTRTGVIEICKRALDTDVTGFFEFTVQGAPGQTFAVPVGACSRAINVTILQEPGTPFTANVTELARTNFRLEDATTFPASRFNSLTLDEGFDANGVELADNTNGGFANVDLLASTTATNQTTVNFFNRSLPGRVKVCKITADPNIPVGTLFRFSVTGTVPTDPTTPTLGENNTFIIDVPAGPDAQDGTCRFVDALFVVGQPVTIVETGLATGQTLPSPLTFADTRVSRIRASTPILSSNLATRTVIINARNTTAAVDFTNFVFRPAILKLCKVAGAGVSVGTNFVFNIALANPLTSMPVSSAPVTVQAGSCVFLNGPFPAVPEFPGIGTFNFNTQLIVTEQAAPGVNVTAITSPSGGGLTNVNLANRTATIMLNRAALSNQFNEIEFTNTAAPVVPAAASIRYDFDGDGISDPVIFRPSTGTWWYGASSAGGAPRASQFGIATDRLVAADFDGDRKTDLAVYRDGEWHIYNSNGYAVHKFGLANDIPQPGDYDGDGQADMAVYRPSDGYWHILGTRDGYMQIRFGISTDMPVAADFDGDGRMDVALYRSGTWYILGSTSGFVAHQFGIGGDKPIAADYDGDGRADLAVVRSGVWHILRTTEGYMQTPFGQPSDSPVPADYDGDGRTDLAVYRSSTNMWQILRSSSTESSLTTLQFGSDGDVLMPY